jgi:GTP-binding protein
MLMDAMVSALASAPEVLAQGRVKRTKLPVRDASTGGLVVEKKQFGFEVRGDRVENLIERTDLESEGALARFQSELDKLGVNAALEAEGVQPGDTVRISGIEFEYQP